MNKKLIRLTESDLHRIVKKSVNRVLNEDISNVKSLRGDIYNIACKIMEISDFETAIKVLDGVKRDFQHYESEEYKDKYRKLDNDWDHTHDGQSWHFSMDN